METETIFLANYDRVNNLLNILPATFLARPPE